MEPKADFQKTVTSSLSILVSTLFRLQSIVMFDSIIIYNMINFSPFAGSSLFLPSSSITYLQSR